MLSRSRSAVFVVLVCAFSFAVSGCAGARLNKNAPKPLTPAERIVELEKDNQAKSQEILRMQEELAALRAREATAYTSSTPVSNVVPASGKGVIRVAGVTADQLQRALKGAGYDPGPIDGRLGNRTKEAVRRFQTDEGLKVDGVVGQKTWSALKRASGSY